MTNAAISAITLDSSYWAATTTDESGRFDLPLFGDFWDLQMNAADRPGLPELLLPRIILRTVDGVDQTNSLFVARNPAAEVVVSVEDAAGSNISNRLYLGIGAVGAVTTMGNTNYVVDNPSMDPSGRLIFHLTHLAVVCLCLRGVYGLGRDGRNSGSNDHRDRRSSGRFVGGPKSDQSSPRPTGGRSGRTDWRRTNLSLQHTF